MNIKLPIYHTCFFIWRLDLMILKWENLCLGLLEGMGPRKYFPRIKIITCRQGRTQGGCTGCTCIPLPPPPLCIRPPLMRKDEAMFLILYISVADPDPGSGAFLTSGSGSGIRNRLFPDLGSRIPNPYFWELSDNFWGKKFNNSLKIGPNFLSSTFQK